MYCISCGRELGLEDSFCPKCGCSVPTNHTNQVIPSPPKVKTQVSFILGVLGIAYWPVLLVLLDLIWPIIGGYNDLPFTEGHIYSYAFLQHITCIFGIIIGIKEYRETNRITGLVLSVLAEFFAILTTYIGFVNIDAIIQNLT